jgi:enediyne polyketide synthase
VTEPVRFTEAVAQAAKEVDLFIEVGPGRVLSGLVDEFVETPIIPLDAGGPSLKGLLQAVGAAFALGAHLNYDLLFADRFSRPFDLNWQAQFLINPCELAPLPAGSEAHIWTKPPQPAEPVATIPPLSPLEQRVSAGVPADTLALVRQLVAARLELPLTAVSDEARLLSDLHLNSISVSQIVAEAARQLGLPVPVSPTDFADVTVVDVAQTLAEIARNGGAIAEQEKLPAGVDAWVRSFSLEWVARPQPKRQIITGTGPWQVIAPSGHPLADSIQQAFTRLGGGGMVVCLPPNPDERHLSLLLQGAQAIFSNEAPRLVLVQHGGGGAAFARTLHLEMPEAAVCVVDVPLDHSQAPAWVTTEALAAVTGYTEARYDTTGQRWEPTLRLLPLDNEITALLLGPDDVLLVTGGGKGIMAECALSLARETGVRLALLGRSQPETDAELAANLERMAASGIKSHYIAADVSDLEAVQAAVQEVETTLGPVTGILHGAARNVPQLLRNLDEETFRRTLAPKVQGVRNLLAAINPAQLRLFVSFGSIIARIGLPGEADYGLANEWLALLTERLQEVAPNCRCLTLDWSVWAGAGMGERLGTLEALVRQGIMPIPLEAGVAMLQRLLAQKPPFRFASPPLGGIEGGLPPAVVVAGRFGAPSTLQVEQPELPFWRFLEQVRVFYPGVELVVEATLSGETDPYLADHVFQGKRLFLAVLGLEAMAQVAMALAGTNAIPIFEDVQLTRPIVVPEGATTTIRVAALRRESGEIEVVLRSQETNFQMDHFRATCRFADRSASLHENLADLTLAQFPPLMLDPHQELYEKHFFHKGRFRRVQSYRQMTARTMVAELSPIDQEPWFSRYLPSDLILGDPGARDATIHAIQVCVPQATLLPISVERVVPGLADLASPRYVRAYERVAAAEADTLVFDVEVLNPAGEVQEVWQGLRLKLMSGTVFAGPWSPPLLGPYLERRLREHLPGAAVTVVVARNPEGDRRTRSDLAIQRALGEIVPVSRRPDGKPEVAGDRVVSVAHAGDLTLAIAAPQAQGPIGCDLEPVTARAETIWQDLLGERFQLVNAVIQAAKEDLHNAATRVWAAGECLKKAGAALDVPLTLASAHEDGWVLLSAGVHVIATYLAQIQTSQEPMVLAVLVRRDHAILL